MANFSYFLLTPVRLDAKMCIRDSMEEADDRQELLEFLSAQLKRDPVKTALIDMTPLGLVEITRKKIRRPLKAQLEQ